MFSTFSTLVRAIQEGQMEPAQHSDEEEEASSSAQQRDRDCEASAVQEGDAPVLSTFFDLASSVMSTVQARTSELVNSVKETDWAGEIEAFKKELQEDTHNIVHSVESSIERFPDQTNSEDLKSSFLQVQSHIRDIGRSLYVGTSDLISQVNDALQEELQTLPGNRAGGKLAKDTSSGRMNSSAAAKYSRYEAEVSAMQRDSSTYCDEPEDTHDFQEWKKSFDIDERKDDIADLIHSNAFMSELQARIVPLIVEYADFWTRYFYRLHKLQQQHEQRVQVVQRALQQRQEEEEISWEDDSEPQSPKADAPLTAAATATAALPMPAGLLTSDDDQDDSGSVERQALQRDSSPDTAEPVEATLAAVTGATAETAADAEPVSVATIEASSDNVCNDKTAEQSTAAAPSTKQQQHDSEQSDKGSASPKAVTGSEGSSGDPWCVVTSPITEGTVAGKGSRFIITGNLLGDSHSHHQSEPNPKWALNRQGQLSTEVTSAGNEGLDVCPIAVKKTEDKSAVEQDEDQRIDLSSPGTDAAVAKAAVESDIDEDWGLD